MVEIGQLRQRGDILASDVNSTRVRPLVLTWCTRLIALSFRLTHPKKRRLPNSSRVLSQHWRRIRWFWHTHPMGEARHKALAARPRSGREPAQPQIVDTLGGRMHVRWDEGAAATPHGQLVFFAEFLGATGVFERWVSSCPLCYRSGNTPDKRDVLGTLMLGLLAGHRRYAHITALRGDAVAAQALGMNKVVSEDAPRRALERIDEASSAAWLRPSLMHSVREVLDRPWVLDIDASIKPLYGRQEGAEIGYNPTKPMRPSHGLHTFLVANLRLVLDVQMSSGKQHSSGHAKTALGQLLDELAEHRPALVRGDSVYGNKGILMELESRHQAQSPKRLPDSEFNCVCIWASGSVCIWASGKSRSRIQELGKKNQRADCERPCPSNTVQTLSTKRRTRQAGMRQVARQPRGPSTFSTRTSPPCRSLTSFTRHRPRPELLSSASPRGNE